MSTIVDIRCLKVKCFYNAMWYWICSRSLSATALGKGAVRLTQQHSFCRVGYIHFYKACDSFQLVNMGTVGRAYTVRQVVERSHLFCLSIRVSLCKLTRCQRPVARYSSHCMITHSSIAATAHGTNWSVSGAGETILVMLAFSVHVELIGRADVWWTVHRNSMWIRKTNQMSLFVFFISLLIVAQHVSGNHVPIIRS